jgi:hypothetical protein
MGPEHCRRLRTVPDSDGPHGGSRPRAGGNLGWLLQLASGALTRHGAKAHGVDERHGEAPDQDHHEVLEMVPKLLQQ